MGGHKGLSLSSFVAAPPPPTASSVHSSSSSSAASSHARTATPKGKDFVTPPARRGYRPPTASRPLAVPTLPSGVALESASVLPSQLLTAIAVAVHTTSPYATTARSTASITSAESAVFPSPPTVQASSTLTLQAPPTSVAALQPPAHISSPVSTPTPASTATMPSNPSSFHAYIPPASIASPPTKKSSGVKKALGGLFGLKSSHSSSSSYNPVISNPTATSVPRSLSTADLIDITAAQQQQQPSKSANIAAHVRAQVAQVKEHGKKVVKAMRKKLSSKSPKEEWPKTWQEWGERYAKYEIDVNDPPPAPPAPAAIDESTPAAPTPVDVQCYNAPKPMNEAVRQATVEKLDLFGRRRAAATPLTITPPGPGGDSGPRSISDSVATSIKSAEQTAETVTSMENHPVFRDIVQKCRDMFDTSVGMLTVFDDDQQLFLAAGGLPEGVSVLPRNASFCAHAILGEDQGLVVLDTHKDWRFAKNLPTTKLGARFYAGVPLYAPTFGDPNAPEVAIGTLCVADRSPREELSEELREQLNILAAEASKAVESWVLSRMENKLSVMEESIQGHSIEDSPAPSPREAPSLPSPTDPLPPTPISAPLTPNPSQGSTSSSLRESLLRDVTLPSTPGRRPKTAPGAPVTSLPPTPPESLRRDSYASSSGSAPSRRGSATEWSNSAFALPSTLSQSLNGSTSSRLNLRVTTETPLSDIPKDLQKVFDQATRMLAKALDLPLVYLVSLDLSTANTTLRLLSAHGLPTPPPSFDPSLHLKALRAAEGGLLYKNPRSIEERALAGGPGYAAGILIPILEVRRTGFVLSGYTDDGDREFGDKEMTYFVRFAEQLENFVMKIGRA